MAKKNVKNNQTATTARVEVFRPGSFTAMSGEEVSYTAADLQALAKTYDPKKFPAPAVVGHPTHDAPAYAWVTAFEYDEEAERLYADLDQIESTFSQNVKDGRYKRISMSFFKPDSDANPKKGAIYPKHVGFLGGAAPAVSGLTPVSFKGSESDAITVEFGDPAFRDVANLFQKFRDFMIDQFGLESADQTVPSYLVNWIDDAGNETDKDNFSSTQEDKPMPGKDDKNKSAEFAEREAALTVREKKIADQEASKSHDGNVAFVDSLIKDGKLITGLKPKVIALMDAVGGDDDVGDLSYVDGGETKKGSALSLLKDVLGAQAKIVDFTETDMDDEPVDTGDSEALAAAATSYMAEQKSKGIDVSASDAVEYVEKQGAKS